MSLFWPECQVLGSIEDVRDRKLEATRTVVERRFSFRIAARRLFRSKKATGPSAEAPGP
jgi:hypothetical protein